jgi:hypothetical protein
MLFADLVGGDQVFLGANPLVYHFNDTDFDRVSGIIRYAPQ